MLVAFEKNNENKAMTIQKTALYPFHKACNGQFFEFAGFEMPIHYGAQTKEHFAVRENVGLFDVSHMCVIDLEGIDAKHLLAAILCNNISKITPNQALYSCILNHNGGVIDDLISYQLKEHHYRLVVNAATKEKDIAWINEQKTRLNLNITIRDDLSIIAVQGPNAKKTLHTVLPKYLAINLDALKPFHCSTAKDYFIARTGYTGEAGYELILPHDKAITLWQSLLQQGVTPCGLGARDTLRLEAGLCLYGADMTEITSPFEANLGFTVSLDDNRDFIGKAALIKQKKAGIKQRLVGIVLDGKGVLRAHQKIMHADTIIGEITSGTFSPTLSQGIALARINLPIPEILHVLIRGKNHPISVVKPPFVRFGQKAYTPITTRKKEIL